MTWRTCSTPVPSLGTDSACCWGARAPGKRKVAPQPGLHAALFLPDGKTTGVVRQGATFNRTGFSKLVQHLLGGSVPGVVLVLAPDSAGLLQARELTAQVPRPVAGASQWMCGCIKAATDSSMSWIAWDIA